MASRERALAVLAGSERIVAFAAHSSKFEALHWPEAPKPWICTHKLALRLWPESPRHSNQVVRYFLGLDLPDQHAMPPHRAAPDAYVTAHILVRALQTGITVEQAIELSAQPALLPRVTFGRHRGTSWQDVDSGFLHWVLERDFDEDVLYTARTELDRREAEWKKQREAQVANAPAEAEAPF